MCRGNHLRILAGKDSTSLARDRISSERSRFDKCVEHLADEIDAYNSTISGYNLKERDAKKLAKRWANECQKVGILPPSWLPVWWLIRIWILPLLIDLAERWLKSLSRGVPLS